MGLVVAVVVLGGCGPNGESSRGRQPNVVPTTSAVTPVTVGGVDLAAAAEEYTEYCAAAAAALDEEILCPTVLPSIRTFEGFDTDLCSIRGELGHPRCFSKGVFLMQEVFNAATSYEGLVGSDGLGGTGHLAVWSGDTRRLAARGIGCAEGARRRGRIEARDRDMTVWYCPERHRTASGRFPIDSGHSFVRWRENGWVRGVSLHGDVEVNERLLVVIANSMRPAAP